MACSTGRLASGAKRAPGSPLLVWMTDKDGIVLALLATESTAQMGRDPGDIYHDLTREFGAPASERVEAPTTPEQKARLAQLSPQQVKLTELAGETIQGAPIGGLKAVAESG
jgi:phosphoglucomutase